MEPLRELRNFYAQKLGDSHISRRESLEAQIVIAGIDAEIKLRESEWRGLKKEKIEALKRELAEQNERLLRLTGESLAQTLKRFQAGGIPRMRQKQYAKKQKKPQPKRAPKRPQRPP
ncbi:MAG: hypothetical protein NT067_05025 [Candidatus Diapherotrites archaeon]|nr:hypothetical protein [Candidatus Diapherotrites archaeon]